MQSPDNLKPKRGGCRSAEVVDLLPAIDIRNGRVVRLSQGERARQTVYGENPLAVAETFVQQGARWIHLVDLDRAFGEGHNQPTVRRIATRLSSEVQLQLGGGLRSADAIRAALELGISRTVIGTAAAVDPKFVGEMVAAIGADRLAVGIDARDGWVSLRGWTEHTNRRADEMVRRVVQDGIKTVIYTDINRDGMLSGPDLTGALALRPAGAHVIVSGGIASGADIRAVCRAGFWGVIVGKALYEGRVSLPEALQAAEC
jgi:phosphoribosylformimino-5-aminoimidazole carboxamide ribotide isomerase